MKLPTALLIVTIMVLLSATNLEARRKHRKKQGNENFHENFEIYHPNGLTIWYPKLRGMVGFGVEVFLNQRRIKSEARHCDICLNTTQTAYGKFIIQDDNAVIRSGDNVHYTFHFYMSNGTVFIKESEFYVSANRVFHQQQRYTATTVSPAEQNVESKLVKYEEDINLLESIVYDVFQQCNNVTEFTKHLYLNITPIATTLNSKQLYEYTLESLQKMLPDMAWNSVLVNAFYNNDGIVFEVMTLIDKLKVLQLSKTMTDNPIIDVDNLDQLIDVDSTNEDYNDISFTAVNVRD